MIRSATHYNFHKVMNMATKQTGAKFGKTLPDLSSGVIVVLSGGPFDEMNPPEVRERMDQLIVEVNADSDILARTDGRGLKFKLLSPQKQPLKHIHQSHWPELCDLSDLSEASFIVLIGHSNGGAAVMDLARCLDGKTIDFAFTADSVFTVIDNGDANKVPANIKLNLNAYMIPTIYWWLLPFPFGRRSLREDGSLEGILNIGLPFEEGGAIAHRDVFYDLAGGDRGVLGYKYPELIREATLAVLKGADDSSIFELAQSSLQIVANEVRIPIDIDTAGVTTTIQPAGSTGPVEMSRLTEPTIGDLRKSLHEIERLRLSIGSTRIERS